MIIDGYIKTYKDLLIQYYLLLAAPIFEFEE